MPSAGLTADDRPFVAMGSRDASGFAIPASAGRRESRPTGHRRNTGVMVRRPSLAGLLLDRFQRDVDAHVVAHVRCVLAGVEFGALDDGQALAPMASFFSIGCGMAWKEVTVSVTGRVNALQRQLAFDAGGLVAVEDDLGRLEGGGRVLCGIEEVLALDVLVEGGDAGVLDLVSIVMSTEPVLAALSRRRCRRLVENGESCVE